MHLIFGAVRADGVVVVCASFPTDAVTALLTSPTPAASVTPASEEGEGTPQTPTFLATLSSVDADAEELRVPAQEQPDETVAMPVAVPVFAWRPPLEMVVTPSGSVTRRVVAATTHRADVEPVPAPPSPEVAFSGTVELQAGPEVVQSVKDREQPIDVQQESAATIVAGDTPHRVRQESVPVGVARETPVRPGGPDMVVNPIQSARVAPPIQAAVGDEAVKAVGVVQPNVDARTPERQPIPLENLTKEATPTHVPQRPDVMPTPARASQPVVATPPEPMTQARRSVMRPVEQPRDVPEPVPPQHKSAHPAAATADAPPPPRPIPNSVFTRQHVEATPVPQAVAPEPVAFVSSQPTKPVGTDPVIPAATEPAKSDAPVQTAPEHVSLDREHLPISARSTREYEAGAIASTPRVETQPAPATHVSEPPKAPPADARPAAEAPRPIAPPQLADLPQGPRAVDKITFSVGGNEGQPRAEILLHHKPDGAIQMAVRTPDAQFAKSLRSGLPELNASLESRGYRSELQATPARESSSDHQEQHHRRPRWFDERNDDDN